MKTFVKDYKEMCIDPQFKFIKKHWVGCIVMNGVYAAVTLAPLAKEPVSKFLKDKLSKKEEL